MLIDCFNCGKKVSENAKLCPQCRIDPEPFYCFLCKKPGKKIRPYEKFQKKILDKEFSWHSKCYEIHCSTDNICFFLCPECGKNVKYGSVQESHDPYDRSNPIYHPTSCPHCGYPFKLTQCDICKKPLYKKNSIKILRKDGFYFLHHSCGEKLQLARRMQGVCEICGENEKKMTLFQGIVCKNCGHNKKTTKI